MLKSSGEYIMGLDPDDKFSNKYNLKYLYEIAQNLQVDIVSFAYNENNKYDIKCNNYNIVIKQPLLFESTFYKTNYGIKDYLLWNKLIKKTIIIKVYNLFKKRMYLKWNFGEDTILSVVINRKAESMLCLKKIIYKYNRNNDSLTYNRHNILDILNRIYILEMMRETLKEENEYKYIEGHLNEFLREIKNFELFLIVKTNIQIKQRVINILQTFKSFIKFSENITTSINNIIKVLN